MEISRRKGEARFRTLFETSNDAICLLDTQGFVDCNAQAPRMFGFANRGDIIGLHPGELSPPNQPDGRDSRGASEAYVNRALEKGYCHFEWIHRKSDVLLSAVRLGDEAVLQATMRDITERRKYEQQLRKLSLAVEQSPVSIVITDLQANIEYVNDAFIRISGYPGEEVLGRNPRFIASGPTPRETYLAMWDALTQGRSWRGELINRRRNGENFIEDIQIKPIRQTDGRITQSRTIALARELGIINLGE